MSDMNNFFMNPDPLLVQQPVISQMNPTIYEQIQQMGIKDNIGELDKLLKSLNQTVLNKLSSNEKFNLLNNDFQSSVQKELLSLVKSKLNTNSAITENIKEQIKIIEETKKSVESEKEASINEMNDYIKNYSHLTFDEYKRMKNGEPIEKKKKCL